jgi:hypothetical protein
MPPSLAGGSQTRRAVNPVLEHLGTGMVFFEPASPRIDPAPGADIHVARLQMGITTGNRMAIGAAVRLSLVRAARRDSIRSGLPRQLAGTVLVLRRSLPS